MFIRYIKLVFVDGAKGASHHFAVVFLLEAVVIRWQPIMPRSGSGQPPRTKRCFSHTAWLSLAIVSGGERQFLPDALPYTFPCRALAFPYDSASTGSPPPSPETRPGLPKRGKDGYSGIPHPQTKSVDKGKLPEKSSVGGERLAVLGYFARYETALG